MRKKAFVVAVIILLSIVRSVSFAQSPNINSGIGWLISSQTATGYWLEVNASEYYSTATALDAVYMLEPSNPSYSGGFAWMTGQMVSPTDYLSRRIIALKRAGADVSSELAGLILYRNVDGGWGGETAYLSDALDTALALKALKAANYTEAAVLYHAVEFLIANQNLDGGWGVAPGYDSNTFVTAHVLKTLPHFNNLGCSTRAAIEKGAGYLLTKQNTDGGFGSSPSTVYESALSVMAMIEGGRESGLASIEPIQNALAYLTSSQLQNGSWNDDPYSTALALQALASVRPNLTASSLTSSKSMPATGETVTLSANVKNTGFEAANNIIVRFYQGDPMAGGTQIGTDTIIPSLAPNANVSVTVSDFFSSTGGKTLFVVADPDNAVSETVETDNRASSRLWIATGADLAVFTGDLKPATFIPANGAAFALEYTIRNLGESAAGTFAASLYDGDPSQGGTLLQSVEISGLAGGQARTNTFGVTLSQDGPHSLYLVVDTGSQVEELSETNNNASVSVTVGGTQSGVDLAIGPGGIVLTPARPTAGETIQIAATIANQGSESAFGFTLEFFDGAPESGGTLIASQELSLAPGVVQTFSASVVITAGIHDLQVVLDRQNSIAEVNEQNNRASYPVMTDMVDVDLSATDLVITPSRPVTGDTVVLNATVRNTGIRETGPFLVALYDGDPAAGGVVLQTWPVANLAGDASQTLPYTFTTAPGTYRFHVVADTENVVAELHEQNNLAVRSLTVKSPGETYGPDLVPVKIDLSGMVTDGQTLAVSGSANVTFQNKGDDKITTSFNVQVFEDKDLDGRYTAGVDTLLGTSAYVTGPTSSIPAIWPDGAGLVSVPLSGTVKFLHAPLYAIVDLGDAVLEQDETNNLLISCKDCEVRPETPIQPVIKWKYNRSDLGSTHAPPVIAPINDTNNDGNIDENDIPAIIFLSKQWNTPFETFLIAVRGDTGQQLFSVNDPNHRLSPADSSHGYMIAGGDIDNDGTVEILASRSVGQSVYGRGLLAFDQNGVVKWDSVFPSYRSNEHPVIADMDHDGNPEIITCYQILNGDGTAKVANTNMVGTATWPAAVVDLDLDGNQEALCGNNALNADGTLKWRSPLGDGMNAVANFHGGPYPEIVFSTLGPYGYYTAQGNIYLLDHNGKILWGPVTMQSLEPEANTVPAWVTPIVADYDGDGDVEIGVKGSDKFFILDKDGYVKQSLDVPRITGQNSSDPSGPTVFDLNGDGRPEVIFASDKYFRIFDGRSGTLLFQDPSYSVRVAHDAYQRTFVSDVNGDGHAEIVALDWRAVFGAGGPDNIGDIVRVYGSANNDWVNARSISNQATYHVTNVNEDGSIPQYESPSWLLNNSYHVQAVVPPVTNPYLAPNLTASYLRGSQSNSGVTLTVRVGNGGAIAAPSGATVTFYDGGPSDANIIGSAATTVALAPGEYQDLSIKWTGATAGLHTITAVVDAAAAVAECDEGDNDATLGIEVPGPDALFGPDLVPTRLDIGGSVTDPQTLGISGAAIVTFQNRGDIPVDTLFDVVVFEDRDNDGRFTTGVDAVLGSLQNAQTLLPSGAGLLAVPLSGTVRFLGAPLHVMIDAGDMVGEQNEANNVLRSATNCDAKTASVIEPVLEWKWQYGTAPSCLDDVTYPPVVSYLQDDNNDGKIDDKDTPYVLFITPTDLPPYWTYWCGGAEGILRAVNGKTGQELFHISDPAHAFSRSAMIAVGDINNDGTPEIVVPSIGQTLLAFRNDGTLLWDNYDQVLAWESLGVPHYGHIGSGAAPAIADLEGDGMPDIIVGRVAVNGDGSIKWGSSANDHYARGISGWTEAVDLDGDGKKEVLAGNTVYNHDGTVRWTNSSLLDGFTAVGNFNDDAYPEIVYATGGSNPGGTMSGTRVYLLDHGGNILWGPVYTLQFEPDGAIMPYAPPPVVADFDGDGEPEIGIRGYAKFMILNKLGQLKLLLDIPPRTTGSNVNATVFDLDGNGIPEVILNTGTHFRIFNGKTGALLHEQPFGAYSSTYQNTIVADVDNDGHAEIVVAGGDSSYGYNASQAGIRVFGALNNDWVDARKVWNQAGYHVTNVNDDGTIPRYEAPSWLLNNTYRCQEATAAGTGPSTEAAGTPLPNLTASSFRTLRDGNAFNMTLRVGNSGAIEAVSGVPVVFYDGDPAAGGTEIGRAVTARTLLPGDYQEITYSWSGASAGLHLITAVIDPESMLAECNKMDNRSRISVEVAAGLPDLAVAFGQGVPPGVDPSEGDLVPVTVLVTNQNEASASELSVGLYLGDPATGGTLVGQSQVIPALAGGSTATVVFTIDTLGRGGENIFYASVDQENSILESNEFNNAAFFTLSVLQPVLPNLTVVADTIQVTPPIAVEGSPITVTATVLNRGADSGDVPVRIRFNLGSGGATVEQDRYERMGLGQSATVTATLSTIGHSGQQDLQVTVDPAGAIAESNETDNSALKPVFIQSAGLTAAIALDKSAYQQNENATAAITITNATAGSRTLQLTMVVMDKTGGRLASAIQAETVTIGAFATVSLTKAWNTGNTLAGDYDMTIELAEGGLNIARSAAAFTIAPDLRLETKVVTDRIAYVPNQTAELSATVVSGSVNYAFENLAVTVSILSADGQQSVLHETTKQIRTLMPGAVFGFKAYWNTGTYPSGTYPVIVQVTDSLGSVLASGSRILTITSDLMPRAVLTGQITIDKQSVMTGDPVTATYAVANVGNVDLSNVVLTLRTVHVKDGTVYATYTDQASLALSTSVTGTHQVDTVAYTAMDYLVVLQASLNGGPEETLAGSFFRVEGAPTTPALSFPTEGDDVQILQPVLTVSNASDPNDDKLTYEFQVFADSGLSTMVAAGGGIAQGEGTTSFTVPADLTENDTYVWRSRAYDGQLYGEWMPPASFRVNVMNDPPTAPTIAAPMDSSEVSSLTPTLTVNNASDPDSVSLTYNFQVTIDPECTRIAASASGVPSGQGTTSWQVSSELAENAWYHWCAQADDWLDVGPWSSSARFFVNTANDAPTVPVVMSPADSSEIASLDVDMVLENSTDIDSPVISYYFEVDTVPTFDSGSTIRSGIIPAGYGTTMWQAIGLLDNTLYYVRARASDGSADSPWTDGVRFFVNTANNAPTTPVIANPSNGAGVSIFTPTLAVHNAMDLDVDSLSYDFEVYGDASHTDLVASAAGIAEVPSATSWTVTTTLLENQTYYWRARSFDGQLASGWAEGWFMVNTANDAPGAPAVVSPADGGSVDTSMPTLTVLNAADPDRDKLTYEFEVNNGMAIVWSAAAVPEGAVGETSTTIAANLGNNTTFQWRCRAYDGSRYGPWTAMASFTVHLPQTGINVDIEIEPETLNHKSKGNWVMAEIELPHGYKASDVDISSIRLEGTLPAVQWPYEKKKRHHKHGCDHERSEHDHGELKVKFRRDDVIAILPAGDKVPVHITGTVAGVPFEGVDIIRVIH